MDEKWRLEIQIDDDIVFSLDSQDTVRIIADKEIFQKINDVLSDGKEYINSLQSIPSTEVPQKEY